MQIIFARFFQIMPGRAVIEQIMPSVIILPRPAIVLWVGLKPVVASGGVIDGQIHHYTQTESVSLFHKFAKTVVMLKAPRDLFVISHIVAAVLKRRVVDGTEPNIIGT